MQREVEQLAGDLAASPIHHVLGDRVAWRRIILRAIEGSEPHRATLRGLEPEFADRARALFAAAVAVRESTRPRRECVAACGLGASGAARITDADLVHRDTMLAAAASCECPR